MADGRDFYEVLGVPRTADPAEIQRAYRKLARQYHPDVNTDPTAEDRFKIIGEAYEVLSDPDKRRRYDAYGADFRRVPEGAGAPRPGRRSGAASRAGTSGGTDNGAWFSSSGGDVNIDDLLGEMFGGRRGFGPMPGADQEAELELSLDDAYRGGQRSLTLSGPAGARTYQVNIPVGVTDGQRIRLAGQGGRGSDGASSGDLYLVVRIAPHPRLRVNGRDVTAILPVTPWEAALGATVSLPTPSGEKKLTVPPGTSSGRRLRLRGQGIPNPNGTPGNFYAEVRIMVPAKLSAQERTLFEQLASASTFDPRSTL